MLSPVTNKEVGTERFGDDPKAMWSESEGLRFKPRCPPDCALPSLPFLFSLRSLTEGISSAHILCLGARMELERRGQRARKLRPGWEHGFLATRCFSPNGHKELSRLGEEWRGRGLTS